jgi:hypothetical protein
VGVANVAALAGLGLTIRVHSGPADTPACDVYCGPAPNLVVALAIAVLSLGLWLVTVCADVAVLIGGRPRRDLALVGLIIEVVPVLALLVAARMTG